jgi:hypothetical protein
MKQPRRGMWDWATVMLSTCGTGSATKRRLGLLVRVSRQRTHRMIEIALLVGNGNEQIDSCCLSVFVQKVLRERERERERDRQRKKGQRADKWQ